MIRFDHANMWWDAATWGFAVAAVVVSAAMTASLCWRVSRRVVLKRRDRRRAQYCSTVGRLLAAVRDHVVVPDVSPRDAIDPVFLGCLAGALDAAPEEVRLRLAAHCERFGYLERFKALTWSRWSWRRMRGAKWLGRLQHRDGISELIRLTDDRASRVRSAAVTALGGVRDPRAQSVLLKLLDGPTPGAGPKRVSVRVLARALTVQGADAVFALLPRLRSPSTVVRRIVADILARTPQPHPRVRAALLGALEDPEGEVRARAAKAIGRIGYAGAIVPLTKTLNDPVWFVRVQAARAIGLLGHARAIRPLVSALTDESWQVRAAASAALRSVGEAAIPALTECLFESRDRYAKEQVVEELQRTTLLREQIEALDNPHAGAAFAAQRFLREMARHGATSVLTESVRQHPRSGVRRRLLSVLGAVDSPQIASLLRELAEQDPDASIRETATRVLNGRPNAIRTGVRGKRAA